MSKDFEKCEVKLMKQHLEDYIEVIKQLPLKKKYTKDELLIPELLVEKYGDIEIYYAPHNEYLNPKAKIFIVGITPGFEQMSTAIAEARIRIEEGLSLDEIKYHYKLLKCFKVEPNLIIHIGSKSFGKENSITRFINNFNKLPNYLKNALLIENDDKVFNVEDTLKLCQKIKRPMVLDVHHHNCNKTEKDLSNYLNEIFNTWDTTPKIHFSSPKNKKDFRAHNDYINSDDFINFIKLIDRDIDVMLEAKAKDDALFRLVRELKYKTNYIFLDETTIKKDL